jgi:hypothetical protein
MTEDLMESVAPQLSPPVTRQPVNTAATTNESGVEQSIFGFTIGGITFAGDEDE